MNSTLSNKEINAVQEILEDILAVARTQLTPEARLSEDLGADSLHRVEIGLEIEEQFQLVIPDENWESVSTVGDLYEALAHALERTDRADKPPGDS